MLTVMMVGMPTTIAQTDAVLSLDPAILPEGGGLGHPGDAYVVSVNIANASNLWAVQFKIKFAPYVSVLIASEIYEGSFLNEGGAHVTYFTYVTDAFEGSFTAIILRMGSPFVGVSGDGTLLTFKLTVVDAGESPIDILDVIMLDPDGNYLPYTAFGGFYYGTIGEFVRMNMPGGRKVRAGETFIIGGKVKNHGDIPLWVRIRYDISRVEDGRKIVIRSGQTYTGGGLGEPLPFEYLYLDEFNEWYYEFTGDPTNALGEPDGLYIEGNVDAQWASLYGFEDIALAGREIANIWVEGYTRYPNGFTEGVDIDLYGLPTFTWWGSCYGTTDWGWHGTRWIDGESVLQQEPQLADETELNNVELLIYNYLGDAPDVIQIDSVRLKVEFAAITPVIAQEYEVLPGGTMELDPVTWVSTEDHIGTYEITATIEYTSDHFHWNSWGSNQKTTHFWIVP